MRQSFCLRFKKKFFVATMFRFSGLQATLYSAITWIKVGIKLGITVMKKAI
jgi:hypothetical protein